MFSYTLLDHHAIIEVSGADAEHFLQGQLTCDLREVRQHGSRLGAHCNIKGHMISLFRVLYRSEQCYWLRCSQAMVETALAQLKKYSIFSKVTLQVREEVSGIGLMDPTGLAQTPDLADWPCQPEHSITQDDLTCVCIESNRFELWGAHESVKAFIEKHAFTANPLQEWLLADIQAGIPDLRQQTCEAFIPQMLNLQVFAGVSFKKGCYTGQEVVTRLQHRGILKRPMYRGRCCCPDASPAPGDNISTQDKSSVGQVVLVSKTGAEHEYEMLLVALKDQAEQHALRLFDTVDITLLPLPYQLDPRLFEAKRL